ncbi:MAG TPA: DUF2336 domain-containing protein [Pseudorhodoplanes sp.]|nr:DUF2336 domain-containing protein [Pseudorhodoplanes sp.]
MSNILSLIPELEEVLQRGAADQRAAMLRRVTDLFLVDCPRYSDEHIGLFDDLFGHLVEQIEVRARAELSLRLAPLRKAPPQTVRRLAGDDDITVAGPVLSQSPVLAERDLLAIARAKSQAHLSAISGRGQLGEALTEVLVDRGEEEVLRKVAANKAARLSAATFARVIGRAENDGDLAAALAARADLPDPLFRALVMRATEVVQRRLLAVARPETQAEIRRVLEKVSAEVNPAVRHFGPALERMRVLKDAGSLGESDLADYAETRNYEYMAAALAELCSVPIEVVDRLLSAPRPDPVLILCKAAGFAWTTARAIIRARPAMQGKSGESLESAFFNFERLSALTAQRVVRFWQTSNSSLRQAG